MQLTSVISMEKQMEVTQGHELQMMFETLGFRIAGNIWGLVCSPTWYCKANVHVCGCQYLPSSLGIALSTIISHFYFQEKDSRSRSMQERLKQRHWEGGLLPRRRYSGIPASQCRGEAWRYALLLMSLRCFGFLTFIWNHKWGDTTENLLKSPRFVHATYGS